MSSVVSSPACAAGWNLSRLSKHLIAMAIGCPRRGKAWASVFPADELKGPDSPFSRVAGLAYFDALDLVAGMLEIQFERKEAYLERAAATRDLDLGWIQFRQGSVAGQRRVYRGLCARSHGCRTQPVLDHEL